jgi:uncharacterized LabA/DUF88 family protein
MSVIKHKGQRVGIFIDTQNLYHSGKNLYKSKVNFGQIVKDALAGRSLIRAVAYVITTESGEEKGFFDALSKVGIETKTKNLQIFSSGAKKADWDVGLAVDAIKLAPKLDTVILVTGDGDFVPLVEYLQVNEGCQVEVVSFGKSSSSRLIEVTDDFLDLDSNPRRYLMMRGSAGSEGGNERRGSGGSSGTGNGTGNSGGRRRGAGNQSRASNNASAEEVEISETVDDAAASGEAEA